jgi:non-ribosomal peptide synthetase component E (peptide arylation enzyme)
LSSPRHILTIGSELPEGVHSVDRLSERLLNNGYDDTGCLENRRFKPTEISIINLTSGSTGFPKFVEYPAGANAAWADGQAPILKLTADDLVGTFAPAARGPSLPAYYDAPWVLAGIFMFPWTGPGDALESIEKNKITAVCIVPTQMSKMLEQYKTGRYDLSTVRLWYSAGAIFPPALAKEVEEIIGGKIISDYGAVDFGGIICPHFGDPQEVRIHTVGKPRFGTEVMIANDGGKPVGQGEVGEIWGRGPACASGYYNDPQTTQNTWTKDGWFPMGDLGKIDAQGNLVIAGRKKNVIIRGAQNIYPSEIEDLLITHAKIREATVVGMPDPVMGERVCVYVALKDNAHLTFEEMIAFLKGKKIAAFKLPERLEIVDKFPLIAEQKIDIQALRKDIENKLMSNEK